MQVYESEMRADCDPFSFVSVQIFKSVLPGQSCCENVRACEYELDGHSKDDVQISLFN